MTRAITTLSGVVSTVRDDIDTGGDRAMTAAPALESSTWNELVEAWRNVQLPGKGWRAEIIEGVIVMTPPPGKPHNKVNSRVIKALARVILDEWELATALGVVIPATGETYEPDLAVVPREVLDADPPGDPVVADQLLLAVEITSWSNAKTDRETKLRGYALGGVPLYLLIDRFRAGGPSVLLYSNPESGSYRELSCVPFGKPIELPDPFNFTLETKEF
ncbi:Uma2 family endonuclease [Saccharopolyspora elongata]|nr:Uma2 family endonuclease [Saccharopolyspora elongata]